MRSRLAAALILGGLLLVPLLSDAAWRCYALLCVNLPAGSGEKAVHAILRARTLDKQGFYDMAEYAYRYAIDTDPTRSEAYGEFADLMRHRGRYSEAEDLFLRAIALAPENDWLRLDLGKLYRNMGRYNDALTALREAEALNPERPELWSYGFSQLYKEMLQFNEAESAGMRAIALAPTSSFHHMSLGDVYREWKKYGDAEQSYRRALELDPKSEAYMGLAWLYLAKGELDRAETNAHLFNERVERPRAEIYAILALIAKRRGNTVAAGAYAAQANHYDRTVLPETLLQ